jgi:ubiquinone biosynthesis UbiH/UbiF/VisC/COQ6 family hydroxylase
MQVWEQHQSASLILQTSDLFKSMNQAEGESSTSSSFLGCCVEDSVLKEYLFQEIETKLSSSVKIFPQTTVTDFQECTEPTAGITGKLLLKDSADQQPATSLFQTKLLVAADGANSAIRQMAGIGTKQHSYGQTAITFTVRISGGGMHRRAYQRFIADGPLALLPTFSEEYAIVVWTTTPQQAQYWKETAEVTELIQHVNDILSVGPELLPPLIVPDQKSTWISNLSYGIDKLIETIQYGTAMAAQQNVFQSDDATSPAAVFRAPPKITEIVSPRLTFPLSTQIVDRYVSSSHRVALVGDAAHTMHPMAGQGLNLGLSDVDALVKTIVRAQSSGMELSSLLHEYETSRQYQVGLTLAGIHGLHKLFHNNPSDNPLLQHVKSLGMNLIQNIAPARRAIVQAACQGVVAL